MERRKKALLILGVVNALLIAGAFICGRFLQEEGVIQESLIWSAALGATGILTFFGVLWTLGGEQASPDSAMRTAMAAAVTVVYLSLLCVAALLNPTTGDQDLPPLSDSMIDSFTTAFGIVIGFYFASAAVVEVATIRARSASPQD